jgi:hypothetical protein
MVGPKLFINLGSKCCSHFEDEDHDEEDKEEEDSKNILASPEIGRSHFWRIGY